MTVEVRKRPRIISIMAVLGFIVSSFQILLISYPGIKAIGHWYPIAYGLIVAIRFASLIGVWHMKRWGAELFAYILIVKIIVQVIGNDLTMLSIVDAFLSTIYAIVFLCFYKRMGRDL
jgi:hypothetical protein